MQSLNLKALLIPTAFLCMFADTSGYLGLGCLVPLVQCQRHSNRSIRAMLIVVVVGVAVEEGWTRCRIRRRIGVPVRRVIRNEVWVRAGVVLGDSLARNLTRHEILVRVWVLNHTAVWE